mgnify:CR=1 FL=1
MPATQHHSAADSATSPLPIRRRWLLLGLGVVVLGVVLATHFLLDPWLRRTLERQVAASTQGRYQLRIGHLETSLWRGGIRLRRLHLRTTAAPAADTLRWPRLEAALTRLDVGGVGLLALVQGQPVPADSVVLDSLAVRLAAWPAPAAGARPLHQRLPVAGLRVNRVAVRLRYAAYGAGRPAVEVGCGTVSLRDLQLSAAGAADSGRIGYAAAVTGQVRGVAVRAPGHTLTLRGAAFSSVSRRLRLDSLSVRPEQATGATRSGTVQMRLALPQLALTGLDAAALSRRRFRADTLRLVRPRVAATLPRQPTPSLHELLAPHLAECRVEQLVVAGAAGRLAGLALAPAVTDVHLAAGVIRVLPRPARADTSIYYARWWQVRTGPASATLDAPYYHVSWQEAEADTRTGRVAARQLLLLPTLGVEALSRRKGHQAAHVSVRVQQAQLSGLDVVAATRHRQLRAAALVLRQARISTRTDGRYPLSPRPSLLTPEALARVPFRFALHRLQLDNANVTMLYRAPRDPRPGVFTINRLAVTLRNLSNDPGRMRAASPLTGTATGWLQNRCRAQVSLRANLLDAAGRHTLRGELGAAPLAMLNPMLVTTRGMRIRQGQVHHIRFSMQLDHRAARGTAWAAYSGLKVQLLNQQEKPGLLPRIGSTLVNGLLLRDDNPRQAGGTLEPGRIASRREWRSSVFSLWRQGLVSGLLNSAGVPGALAKKLSEAE